MEPANVWIKRESVPDLVPYPLNYEVLESEERVGRAMLEEIRTAAREKIGDLTIVLLGGRGAQAMHRQLGVMATTGEVDALLARLHVFTQDALAPMRVGNPF